MKLDFAKLDRIFNPRCVAVVGDSKKQNFMWLHAQNTFKGKLYSVQVSPKNIELIEKLGWKNYSNLRDIPDPVDLVIVSVPRKIAPDILEDCIQKGVAGAHFFTAGFSETDTEEGIRAERLLVKRAKAANFYIIGPNCMGIFNPKVGIRQMHGQYTDTSGPVGLISQSGTHAISFSLEAHLQGLDINKSVSFGNGTVLDSSDFLEYFGLQDDIKAVGMYLEGVKDGRRFLDVLKEVAARKPVVIWKGGRSEAGGRAIASHTGSLALSQAVWDAAMRQCGVVGVKNMEELIDTLKAILQLSPVRGDRVVLAGGSGGQSVAITDAFTETGLKVPLLTQKSYKELATFFTLVGGSYRNPIDTGNPNRRFMKRIMEIIEQDANVDNLVLLMSVGGRWRTPAEAESDIKSMVEIRQKTSKPIMAIVMTSLAPKAMHQAMKVVQRLEGDGIAAFLGLERGARALKNALSYYRLKNNHQTINIPRN